MYVIQHFVAALYDTTLEKNAIEFAVAYVNQKLAVSPPYWLATLNISSLGTNETTRITAGNLTHCSLQQLCLLHV